MLGDGSRTRWGVAEQIAAAGDAVGRFKVDKKQRYLVNGRDGRSEGKRQRYLDPPCFYFAEGKTPCERNVRVAHSNNLFQRPALRNDIRRDPPGPLRAGK